jgi:hypothetical protein
MMTEVAGGYFYYNKFLRPRWAPFSFTDHATLVLVFYNSLSFGQQNYGVWFYDCMIV